MPAPTIRMSGLFMVHLSAMPRGQRWRSPFDKFTSVAAWCNGDFNADGAIGGQDFIIWSENKFTSSDGVTAVPEPGTGVFLVGVLISVTVVRPRRSRLM